MPGINEIREAKRELRRIYKTKRSESAKSANSETNELICGFFLNSLSYKYGKKLLLFYPINDEPNILKIIDTALSQGREVFFPRTYPDGTMKFFKVNHATELISGKYNLKEPDGTSEEYVKSTDGADICLVPGLCFDTEGYRIGYGKGYYDRFLSHFEGVKIGIIYSGLIFDGSLPREKRYDKHVDFLITEKEMKPIVS